VYEAGDRSSRGEETWESAIFIARATAAAVHGKRNQQPTVFGTPNRTPFVKDGINNFVVHGQADAVNPQQTGTKARAHYRLTCRPEMPTVRLRLDAIARGIRRDKETRGAFGAIR
jgi:hypothetical protein